MSCDYRTALLDDKPHFSDACMCYSFKSLLTRFAIACMHYVSLLSILRRRLHVIKVDATEMEAMHTVCI